jgi:FKBP-type peptidyl-prolyl cis-trans isomerase FkpA
MLQLFRRSTILLATVVLAACGGDSGPTAPSIEETTFDPSLGVDLSQMTKTESGLYWRDLTVGTGATAEVYESVKVGYTLWLPNGTKIEESSSPITFTIGRGQVIKGWDQGVPGMKEGGVRLLVIPPSLAYGDKQNGDIPANSILVFRVEMVDAP